MSDRCPRCGALIALVGNVHRCSAKPEAIKAAMTEPVSKPSANSPANKLTDDDDAANKRREYMRDLMRRKRAKAREVSA